MSETVFELAERGRTLPPKDRERLIELLLETLVEPAAPEVEEAWAREIERRVTAYKDGEVESYDLESVLAEAKHIAP